MPYAIVLLAALLTACGGPPLARETAYPGSGTGRVEKRTPHGGGPTVFRPDGTPGMTVYVPAGGVMVPMRMPSPEAPRYFTYEIRTRDDSLVIVQADKPLDPGACVEYSGHADGPSMSHWSLGRVTIEKSEKCNR